MGHYFLDISTVVGFEGPDLSMIYVGILYQIQSTSAVNMWNWTHSRISLDIFSFHGLEQDGT